MSLVVFWVILFFVDRRQTGAQEAEVDWAATMIHTCHRAQLANLELQCTIKGISGYAVL